MAYSTKFFLKEPGSKFETLVYLTFSFNKVVYTEKGKKYLRLKYSTGEKISPEHWDFGKCLAKQTQKFAYQEFNTRLNRYKATIENIYRKMLNNGEEPSIEALRNEMDIVYGKNTRKPSMTLFGYLNLLINNPEIKKDGTQICYNTVKGYRSTMNHLAKFCKATGRSLNFDDIDMAFYMDFVDYLLNSLNLSQNSAGKYIKILKTIMGKAREEEHHQNMQFKHKKFIAFHSESENIYMTIKELDAIYYKDLTDKPSLDRVRDYFIIGCFTGLRFSDFTQINADNVYQNDNGNFLKVKTQKTGKSVVIPLHPFVKAILAKYGNNLPCPISNQKMNSYLKDLVKMAGINNKVQKAIFKGGKSIKKGFEKWQLVTTHTARRSFATNAYLAGEKPLSIMQITGHQSEKEFMKYIKIGSEENAIKLQNGAFFSQPVLKIV